VDKTWSHHCDVCWLVVVWRRSTFDHVFLWHLFDPYVAILLFVQRFVSFFDPFSLIVDIAGACRVVTILLHCIAIGVCVILCSCCWRRFRLAIRFKCRQPRSNEQFANELRSFFVGCRVLSFLDLLESPFLAFEKLLVAFSILVEGGRFFIAGMMCAVETNRFLLAVGIALWRFLQWHTPWGNRM